jgi:prolyl-tRNA synthetase
LTKSFIPQNELRTHIPTLLEQIQKELFEKAKNFRDAHITEVNSFEEFKQVISEKGGFVSAYWDGTVETEDAIKKETKATIRCIPYQAQEEVGVCIYSGKPSSKRVFFAKAY